MSIEFTILAFLSSGPLSGYDLKKMFAQSEALPWSGNNNQVYRVLVGLHGDGLTFLEVQQPADGPARKLYTITPQGITALREWLRSETEAPQLRAPIVSRLIAAEVLSAEDLDLLLSRYAEEVRLKLLGIEEIERRGVGVALGSPRQRLLWQCINSRPIQLLRAEEAWVRELRWALARLETTVPSS